MKRSVPQANPKWTLRLYIAGKTPKSMSALANLEKLCKEQLAGSYRIVVVDLIEHPEQAKADQIVAIPTLVRMLPPPLKKIIGALSNKDSVIVVDKINKNVQYRSLSYLQDVTDIPFDFKTLQDLLVGNPIYFDSTIVSFKQSDDKILLSTIGKYFKHLLTLTPTGTILHSKLDDVDITRNRTADITYGDYLTNNGIKFSTYREITVSEKNKLDIRLNFKQYDFNKEVSISFNIPKNYKRK